LAIDLNTGSTITEEMVARVRARLGEESPISEPFNTEATRDTIRHWAEAIGDVNPLWINRDYAAKTRHGTIVAPPSFLYSCNQGPAHRGRQAGGWRGFPGIHRVWVGEEWEWHLPIRLGDQIRGTTKMLDLVEHQTNFAGRTFEDIHEQSFFNQRDELIAVHRMMFMSTERAGAAKRGVHKAFEKTRYSAADLDKIWEDVQAEVVRGAEPRYWEDVQPGEEIPQVVKGPYSTSEAVAFVMGWGGPFIMASEVTWRYTRAHPKANVPDRETNAPDFPERAHWDDAFAREVGFPAAYDFGGQRVSWLIHMLTNWAGDDGFLRHLSAKLTRFNVMGDTTWCKGTVTGKTIEDGRHLVDLDVWGVNQRGETNFKGQARVELPSRT
jgi:acyl dehydratase